ncbi:MAG: FHA domain-containing protein [Actinomycetia bacterium]|nr:FHA domain-containing protein [Actinomycetes bacterium]
MNSKNCKICGAPVEGDESVCARCIADSSQSTTSFAPVGTGDSSVTSEIQTVDDEFSLAIVKGPNVGRTFTIEPEEIMLGRDIHADVFLNDMTVSREHASIVHRGDTVIIRDAGSLNGTYVNGVCVDESELHNGDRIQIGTFHLKFFHNDSI